jgi:hypothetical protein
MGLVQIRIQILQKPRYRIRIRHKGIRIRNTVQCPEEQKVCKICEMFMALDLQTSVADLDPRRIRMFLGILDPDPDPLVRGTDPDPSIIKQK